MNQQIVHSLPYRRDIDGLRGIAVLLVVGYHAGVAPLTGGFTGVDVFFVISGYLITQVILKGLHEGTFTYRGFYLRRARRLFPALFALLAACSLVGVMLYPPPELRLFGTVLSYVALFGGNVWFALHQFNGYFAVGGNPSILQHTWSLAVEEQFYLLYPLLVASLMRRNPRAMRPVLLLLTALSLAGCLWWTAHHHVGAFYLLPPRAWELFAGAAIGAGILPSPRSRLLRELAVATGLAMIAAAAVRFTPATNFPGYAATLPVAGAALVLWAGAGASFSAGLLRSRPLVGAGLLSYSLYLWHWPVFVLARYIPCSRPELPFPPLEQAGLILLSLALAWLSWRFVEQPFRSGPLAPSDRRLARYTIAAALLILLLGRGFVYSRGLPERFRVPTRNLLWANSALHQDLSPLLECDNGSGPRTDDAPPRSCRFGQAPHNVLLVGDSHAAQLLTLFRTMQAKDDFAERGVITAVTSGCPPDIHLNSVFPGSHCDRTSADAWHRTAEPDIDIVFIQFYPWWGYDGAMCEPTPSGCGRLLTDAEIRRIFLTDLAAAIETLRSQGKRVVLGMPFPAYEQDIPNLQIRKIMLGRFAPVKAPQERLDSWRSDLLALAARERIGVFDPHTVLCPGGPCQYQIDGVGLIRDSGHMADSKTGILEEGIRRAIAEAPAGASPEAAR